MPTWQLADDTTLRLIRRVMKDHHAELIEAGVTFTALFASIEDDEPPPLKINNYPQAAIVRKTSARDRVAGKADIEIYFDEQTWATLPTESRTALVDHELEHVVIPREAVENGGGFKQDSAGRPKVILKNHDWQIGGFRIIAERHGDAALEVQAARDFQDRYGQYVFGFAGAHK